MTELEQARVELARLTAAVSGVRHLVTRLLWALQGPPKRGRPFGGGNGGVYPTQSGKWRARVMVDGHQVCGPSRATKAEAERDREAYCAKAK